MEYLAQKDQLDGVVHLVKWASRDHQDQLVILAVMVNQETQGYQARKEWMVKRA